MQVATTGDDAREGASMRPRLEAGECPITILSPGCIRSSFNEAPAGGRGMQHH